MQTDFKNWDLRFENRTNEETQNIRGFLEARRGVESFAWTNPYGETSYYVCEEWSVEHATYNLNNIQAKFREVIAL